jgi:hypothetical protein
VELGPDFRLDKLTEILVLLVRNPNLGGFKILMAANP